METFTQMGSFCSEMYFQVFTRGAHEHHLPLCETLGTDSFLVAACNPKYSSLSKDLVV